MKLDKIKNKQKISLENLKRYEWIAKKSKIKWHPTTPKNFSCEAGCRCCCGPTYYFPSEVENLPEEIVKNLEWDKFGLLFVPKIGKGGCPFHGNPRVLKWDQHGCMIHGFEPLRCQLYPYWPIIVGEDIVIMSNAHCDVFHNDDASNPLHICYGIGKGEDVTERIEKLSREFLLKEITEAPGFLTGTVFTNPDDLLSPKIIKYQNHRKYETHREALPHIIQSVMAKNILRGFL